MMGGERENTTVLEQGHSGTISVEMQTTVTGIDKRQYWLQISQGTLELLSGLWPQLISYQFRHLQLSHFPLEGALLS